MSDKICIAAVTTSRADYGLLLPLLKKIEEDTFFELHIIATGSHLSELHGRTIDQIINDGFSVDHIVEMTSQGDSEYDICEAVSSGIKGFAGELGKISPDLLIVLGDRYELWPACMAGVVYKVPIAHIHGGEVTYGAIDEVIRHSVTKMASIHFPTIELYAKRIMQMGENPKNVHVVGALGIDNIKSIDLMSVNQLSQYTGIDFNQKVALMTYHPVTLDDYNSAPVQAREVLEALLKTELQVLITMPNADTGSKAIYEIITQYIQKYPEKLRLVKNLGQLAYLSAMKYAKLMIGNSSSGIIESASFKLPVVNIGDRQAGRYKPQNIIDCLCSKDQIIKAINRALSSDFRHLVSNISNPYGDGNSASRIVDVLKTIDFNDKASLLKKHFYDFNITGQLKKGK